MDRQYDSYYADKQNGKREGGAFTVVVIVAVVVLLALTVLGLLRLASTGEVHHEIQMPLTTSQPSQPKTPAETPVPAATPEVTQEDRVMPELDGVVPTLPFTVDNPIPDIFDAAAPGVVGVVNYTTQPETGIAGLQVYGSGSGFIVSSDGYILTNAHVVDGGEKITVLMDNGEEIETKVIGKDLETDIAVLKIDKTGLPALALGDSDKVRVGEYVLAIGNPLDADKLANTLTFGIISALTREITIDDYTNTYLQTDAAINYGNSGGPLLNMQGEVIGINSAKTMLAGYDAFGNAVSAEGIGFALPINKVKIIMESLIRKGKVDRPGVGIVVSSITETIAEAENVPDGALVVGVVKGGPSSKAGVLVGDIIVEANGTKVSTQTELVEIVEKLNIGESLVISVFRDGEYMELTIVVENKTDMNFDDVEES